MFNLSKIKLAGEDTSTVYIVTQSLLLVFWYTLHKHRTRRRSLSCGHESLSTLFRCAHNLLSVLDPGSRFVALGRGDSQRSALHKHRTRRRSRAQKQNPVLLDWVLFFALVHLPGLGPYRTSTPNWLLYFVAHKVSQSGFESFCLKYKKLAQLPAFCISGAPARTRT